MQALVEKYPPIKMFVDVIPFIWKHACMLQGLSSGAKNRHLVPFEMAHDF